LLGADRRVARGALWCVEVALNGGAVLPGAGVGQVHEDAVLAGRLVGGDPHQVLVAVADLVELGHRFVSSVSFCATEYGFG
jgi:hypothetical protein